MRRIQREVIAGWGAAALLLLLGAEVNAQEAGSTLSGRWIYLEQLTTVADLTVLGETYSTVRAIALYDLEEEGSRLRGPGALCDVGMRTESRFIQTVLPPSFRQAVAAPALELELIGEGATRRVAQARQVRVVGARLTDPLREALPTRAADPRVEDQDRDGHPGVTVRVEGFVEGEIYLVQRQWNELTGALKTPDRIEGQLRFGREERVLEATHSALEEPPPVKSVYRRSFFRMLRVPAQTTCAEVQDAFSR